jgi:hypothetical protein
MGHGTYSVSNSIARNATYSATNASNDAIFTTDYLSFTDTNRKNTMNPSGVELRESRDSAEHPDSFAIVLALDVTGSMGSIPNFLVKNGLPTIMDQVMRGGEADPQVLFLGVGDHECDSAPLQVGQFESSDELLDKWLKETYLEGGGGGNTGESYLLAWYFAGYRTAIDCFEKRGRKGLLFTIGDEPVLPKVDGHTLNRIFGSGQFEDYSALSLLDKAREKYDVYHIHVRTGTGMRQNCIDGWKQIMGSNLIVVNNAEDVAKAISDTVLKHKKGVTETTVTSMADEEVL